MMRCLTRISVAAASAARLSGAALGAFASAALVLLEACLTGVDVVRHRSLREVLAFVGVDDDTARTTREDKQQEDRSHEGGDHITQSSLYTSRMKHLLPA